MRTNRFRIILLATLVLLVALGATRSRSAAPSPRARPESTPKPPPAGSTDVRSSGSRRKQFSRTLTVRTHGSGLILLAALVLFVASPAVAEPVRSITPVIAKPNPTLAALAGPKAADSKPAGDTAQIEGMTPGRPVRAVTPSIVKPSRTLAVLLSTQEAFAKPTRDSVRLGLVLARRPLTEARTVLPVVGARIGPRGVGWLHVMLPGRPNGRTGWIKSRATVASTTTWHIFVHVSQRRVTVYRSGRPVRVVKAVVGSSSTPTPHGRFFVEEAIQLRATDVGAPYALAMSARSNVLQQFNGGPGQIALHGLANVGGALGTAVSHGCVRLDNDMMRWLVHRIGPGVPVTVTR